MPQQTALFESQLTPGAKAPSKIQFAIDRTCPDTFDLPSTSNHQVAHHVGNDWRHRLKQLSHLRCDE
eukprot:10754657-Alexandrium_andersonii.AAC.1